MNISLVAIAIIVSVLWLAIYGFYIYSSNQHQQLEQDIERLERRLDETE